MELKKLNPIATAPTPAAPQARSNTTLKPAALNAVDAFEAAKAPAFQKPNLSSVTAESPAQEREVELIYRVRSGDTLTGIARTMGTSVAALQSWNYELVEQPDKLQVGQKIILPNTFHEVTAGETYSSIARKTGISPRALMTLNDAPSDGMLNIGQEIRVPAAILTQEQAAMREKLKAVIADGGRAWEQMCTGDNSVTPYDSGDALGWFAPLEEGGQLFAFSDDYKSMKVWQGEESSDKPLALNDPPNDIRRAVMKNSIETLAGLFAYQQWEAAGDDNAPFPEVTTLPLPDGRTQFVVEDLVQGPLTITYDPRAASISLTGGDRIPWTGPATSATSTVLELGGRLGVRMPFNPVDQTPEEPGIQ